MDIQILHMLNSYPVLDPLMVFLSVAGEGPLWILIALYLYLSVSKRKAMFFCLMILSVWMATLLLKSWFMLPRPEDVRLVVEASGYSMPSTHSSMAFATAIYLHPAVGKYRPLVWAGAFLMGISRVFTGVHYPSDVIAGAILGLLIGLIWIWIEKHLQQRGFRINSNP